MNIQLVQVWAIPERTPHCAKCDRLAATLQSFEFVLEGKRVCPECALAASFTCEPDLLNRVLHAYTYRPKGRHV